MAKTDLLEKKKKVGGTLPSTRATLAQNTEKNHAAILEQRKRDIKNREDELNEVQETIGYLRKYGLTGNLEKWQSRQQQAASRLNAARQAFDQDVMTGIQSVNEKYRKLTSGPMGYGQIADIDDVIASYDGLKGYAKSTNTFQTATDNLKKYRDYLSGFESEDHYRVLNMSPDELKAELDKGENPVAYTTKDGYNFTWQNLYDDAMQRKDLDDKVTKFSVNADWDSLGSYTGEDILADYQSLYGIGSQNVPMSREEAQRLGYDRRQYEALQDERREISEKYGVDLSDHDAMTRLTNTMREIAEYTDEMTADEKAVLSSLFRTEGAEAALDWFDSRRYLYEGRKAGTIREENAAYSKAHPIKGSLKALGSTMLSPLEYVADTMRFAGTDDKYYNMQAVKSGAYKQGVTDRYDWKVGNADAFDFLYNTGMSGVESFAAGTFLGPYGGVVLGMSAAAQTTNDAFERGMDKKHAVATGIAAGVAEMLFEEISIGNLNALKEIPAAHVKDIAKNIGKSLLVNASEETATEVANIAYDMLINGDFSQWDTEYRQNIANDMTPEQAKAKAWGSTGKQVVEAGASGALMGFGFGVTGSGRALGYNAAQAIDTERGQRAAAKDILARDGGVAQLRQLAEKTAAAGSQIGKQLEQASAKAGENASVRNVRGLYRTLGNAFVQQDTTQVAQALQEKGMDGRTAAELARAIVDNTQQKILTDRQSKLLEEHTADPAVQEVIDSVIRNPESEMNQRRAALQGMEGVNSLNRYIRKRDGDSATRVLQNVLTERTVDQQDGQGTGETAVADPLQIPSTEGKVVLGDTTVQIADVQEAGNGKLTVRLADGRTADSGELSFPDQGTQELYRTVAKVADNAEAAKMLIEGYYGNNNPSVTAEGGDSSLYTREPSGGVPAQAYARAVEQLVFYGKHQIPMEQLVAESPYVQQLTPAQRNTAYQLGEAAGNKKMDASQSAVNETHAQAQKALGQDGNTAKETHTVTLQGYNKGELRGAAKLSYQLAQQIAAGVQGDIVIYNGGKEWGSYDADTDTIYLNGNIKWQGKTMLAFTLAHELVHRAKAGSPAQYRAFTKFLLEQYGKQGSDLRGMIAHQMYAAKQAGRNLTREQALEEVFCDAAMRMLIDTDAGKKLAQWGAQSSQNKTFLEKVKTILENILNRLRSYFAGVDPDNMAAQEFAKFDENAKQILADMFVDMSKDAGEKLSTIKQAGMLDQLNKNTAQEGGVKYKIVAPFVDNNGVQYDSAVLLDTAFFGDRSPRNWGLKLRDFVKFRSETEPFILPVLDENGNVQRLEFAKLSDRVYKSGKSQHDVLDELSTSSDNISKLAVVHIDEIIDSSEEDIPYYTSQDPSVNHSWLDRHGWLHRVAYVINAKNGGIYRLVVDVAKADDGRHIMYATKGKINRVGTVQVNSLKSRGSGHNSNSSGRITQIDTEVKRKDLEYQYAVSRKDMKAAEELIYEAATEAGYTIKAYHGTNSTFWQFKSGQKRTRGRLNFGQGFYFAPNKMAAANYTSTGRVMDTFLKITKPYTVYGTQFDRSDLERIAKETGRDVTYENVTDVLREAGYDGIIAKSYNGTTNPVNQYVVFNANQIKSADTVTYDDAGNVIPLSERFNSKQDDIRYKTSVSEDISPRELLVRTVEGMVANSAEWEQLQKYRKKIKELNAAEEKVERLGKELQKLYFPADGQPRDNEMIENLQRQRNEAIKLLTKYDSQLINLENTKPIRDIVKRMRQASFREGFQKAKDYYREKGQQREDNLRQQYQESRRAAVERHDKAQIRQSIRKDVERLNSLLNKGNKQKNVKQELKEFASIALRIAQGHFLKNYNEYDMVRNGVHENVIEEENKPILCRCQELLAELDQIRDEKSAEPGADNIHDKWDPEGDLRREDREEALKKELAKNMAILREANVFKLENNGLQNAKADQALEELLTAYQALDNSELAHVRGVYSDVIYGQIEGVKKFLAGKAIKDMTTVELKELQKMYRLVLHTISTSNELFAQKRKADVRKLGEEVISQLQTEGKVMELELLDKLKKMGWSMLKPETALELIGSDTLTEMMQGLYRGEDTYARDIEDGRKFAAEQAQKYGRKNWDMEKPLSFAGTKITLGQAMSLYAYTKRKQAQGHLEGDGFTSSSNVRIKERKGKLPVELKYIMNATKTHKVSKEMYEKVAQLLTPQQKKYADAMQEYLSKVMGAKGNEVAMQLYGIPLFEETMYFPLKTASEYQDEALAVKRGDVKLKNSGFTKSVQEKARNPIVLDDFESVWAAHVDKMSLYHGFVLPMEDFDRVYNYHRTAERDVTDAEGEVYKTELVDTNETVKVDIENKAGKAANEYIETFMQQLNGGVRGDSTEKLFGGRLRNFKKTAVLASLSVAVQQPTAFVRAMAQLDMRDIADWRNWLGKTGKPDGKLVEEMYKYAPVALMKHIGGFDPGIGRSSKEYMIETKKGVKKWIDNVAGWLPEKMDEMTWTYIWVCTKRQIHRENPQLRVGSKEFCEKAGERFSQIIRDTQVYDSVLTKSQIMRSKNVFLQMATSFMNEPTTSMDMYIRSTIQAKRGKISKKQAARTYAAVMGSQLVCAAVAAFVYAARDDDEDETYWEKYMSAAIDKAKEGILPWYSIPFVKDVFSIFEGYDVERSDMSLVVDIFQGWKKLGSSNATAWEKLEAFGGSIVNLFGIPAKNLSRDLRGIYNTIDHWINPRATGTKRGMGYAALEGLTGKKVPKTDQMIRSMAKGDSAHMLRLMATYDTQDSAESAVRSALKEGYLDGKFTAEDTVELLQTYGGLNAEDAQDKLVWYDFQKLHPESELKESAAVKWVTEIRESGISLAVYTEYRRATEGLESDKDANGNTISGSKKKKVVAQIHALPLTRQQKDALFLAEGYAESGLEDTPWN